MDAYLPTLRLEFPDTYNDYRLLDGVVQFRVNNGEWRTLDQEDVRMHFILRTPVATWIRSHSEEYNRVPRLA
jgi:hypothetical protein